MGYAYSNNGQTVRAWDDPENLLPGELYFDNLLTEEEKEAKFSGYAAAIASQQKNDVNMPILEQINALEDQGHRANRAITLALLAGQTPNADDVQKLQSIDSQIAALRAQLQK